MEKFLEKLGWKKMAIIIIGVCLILIFLLVLTFRSTSSPTPKIAPTPTPVPGMFRSVEKPNGRDGWQNNHVDDVAVSYPSDWFMTRSEIENGGYVLNLYPISRDELDGFPRVDIMVFPFKEQTQIENLISQLLGVGFDMEPVAYQGVPAAKLSSEIAGSSFAGGNPQKKDVIKDAFIFQKAGKVFEIDYSYYKDSNQEEMGRVVSDVLRSIELSN